MTTGPEQAREAVNDTSADVPDERDARETRNEQGTPEAVQQNAMETAHEDAGDLEDAGDREDTATHGEAPSAGATQIPQQPGDTASTAAAVGTGTGTGTGSAMSSGGFDADVNGPLLTEGEELRSSWQRIQAGFVDDPRGSVAQAAAMVEETAETLVATIQERERVLRGGWEGNGGAAADTEKLRITLGKYRTFFEKITGL